MFSLPVSVVGKSFLIRAAEECPGNTDVSIEVNISSYGNVCWTNTFSITVQEPVSIEDVKETGIRIYPNPTTNQLTIEFDERVNRNTSIAIMDITGKTVYSVTLDNTAPLIHTINLSSFEEGLYLIKINNDQYSYTEKVIKVE